MTGAAAAPASTAACPSATTAWPAASPAASPSDTSASPAAAVATSAASVAASSSCACNICVSKREAASEGSTAWPNKKTRTRSTAHQLRVRARDIQRPCICGRQQQQRTQRCRRSCIAQRTTQCDLYSGVVPLVAATSGRRDATPSPPPVSRAARGWCTLVADSQRWASKRWCPVDARLACAHSEQAKPESRHAECGHPR